MTGEAEQDRNFAVRLNGIGKVFSLSSQSKQQGFQMPWKRRPVDDDQEFWALRDISMDLPKGKSVGILGLNGAGKSTLLQIIAGNIKPSEGQLHVDGQVQLLQLGAGFVMARSGRDNVIDYARARGRSTEEIEQRVAYVQEFADIGPFFDQPMSSYSSGMNARVAFGNAFAVDPDIMIIDEALAVGDAVFVNKCFRRIQEMRESGTTIIFVSHSSDSVLRLCELGVVLDKGKLIEFSDAPTVVKAYHGIVMGNGGSTQSDFELGLDIDPEERGEENDKEKPGFHFHSDQKDRLPECPWYNPAETLYGKGGARILECIAFVNDQPVTNREAAIGTEIEIRSRVRFDSNVPRVNFGFILNDSEDVPFYGTNLLWRGDQLESVSEGEERIFRFRFRTLLSPGNWFFSLAVADDLEVLQQRMAAIHFIVSGPSEHVGKGWLDLEIGLVESDAQVS